MKQTFKFSSSSTDFYFNEKFSSLKNIIDIKNVVFITDENVFAAHRPKFKSHATIVLNAGEEHKVQATVDSIIQQLISAEADRKTFLVGVGGGVVTDITGYAASIYMRGINFGFVPTTLLGLVDASIGGKNGVDVGVYKNMVGIIRQPKFLLHDYSLLKTLPQEQWINGFAEIIKHAAIKDAAMFKLLETHSLQDFQKDKDLLGKLIQRNALLKAKVVQEDEFEQANRKLLNFGHTLGHAIENKYQLLHGQAVAIGMVAAAYLSKAITDFSASEKLIKVIETYGLPAFYNFDVQDALQKMLSDKKRVRNTINYVLLNKIGEAVYKPLTIEEIKPVIEAVAGK